MGTQQSSQDEVKSEYKFTRSDWLETPQQNVGQNRTTITLTNRYDPSLLIEQHVLMVNNGRDLQLMEEIFRVRNGDRQLVNVVSYFLVDPRPGRGVAGYAYLEKIKARLPEVGKISYLDSLHVYWQVLNGCEKLVKYFSYFKINPYCIGINNKNVAKIWHNPNFVNPCPFQIAYSESEMILSILDSIDGFVDERENGFSFRRAAMSDKRGLGFEGVLHRLEEEARYYNTGAIPESMSLRFLQGQTRNYQHNNQQIFNQSIVYSNRQMPNNNGFATTASHPLYPQQRNYHNNVQKSVLIQHPQLQYQQSQPRIQPQIQPQIQQHHQQVQQVQQVQNRAFCRDQPLAERNNYLRQSQVRQITNNYQVNRHSNMIPVINYQSHSQPQPQFYPRPQIIQKPSAPLKTPIYQPIQPLQVITKPQFRFFAQPQPHEQKPLSQYNGAPSSVLLRRSNISQNSSKSLSVHSQKPQSSPSPKFQFSYSSSLSNSQDKLYFSGGMQFIENLNVKQRSQSDFKKIGEFSTVGSLMGQSGLLQARRQKEIGGYNNTTGNVHRELKPIAIKQLIQGQEFKNSYNTKNQQNFNKPALTSYRPYLPPLRPYSSQISQSIQRTPMPISTIPNSIPTANPSIEISSDNLEILASNSSVFSFQGLQMMKSDFTFAASSKHGDESQNERQAWDTIMTVANANPETTFKPAGSLNQQFSQSRHVIISPRPQISTPSQPTNQPQKQQVINTITKTNTSIKNNKEQIQICSPSQTNLINESISSIGFSAYPKDSHRKNIYDIKDSQSINNSSVRNFYNFSAEDFSQIVELNSPLDFKISNREKYFVSNTEQKQDEIAKVQLTNSKIFESNDHHQRTLSQPEFTSLDLMKQLKITQTIQKDEQPSQQLSIQQSSMGLEIPIKHVGQLKKRSRSKQFNKDVARLGFVMGYSEDSESNHDRQSSMAQSKDWRGEGVIEGKEREFVNQWTPTYKDGEGMGNQSSLFQIQTSYHYTIGNVENIVRRASDTDRKNAQGNNYQWRDTYEPVSSSSRATNKYNYNSYSKQNQTNPSNQNDTKNQLQKKIEESAYSNNYLNSKNDHNNNTNKNSIVSNNYDLGIIEKRSSEKYQIEWDPQILADMKAGVYGGSDAD